MSANVGSLQHLFDQSFHKQFILGGQNLTAYPQNNNLPVYVPPQMPWQLLLWLFFLPQNFGGLQSEQLHRGGNFSQCTSVGSSSAVISSVFSFMQMSAMGMSMFVCRRWKSTKKNFIKTTQNRTEFELKCCKCVCLDSLTINPVHSGSLRWPSHNLTTTRSTCC